MKHFFKYKSQLLRTFSTHPSESFLHPPAINYMEQMYQSWQKDPSSVHISWKTYFENVKHKIPPGSAVHTPPTLISENHLSLPPSGVLTQPTEPIPTNDILDHMKVQLLVRAYQVRGHHLANLDPLGILQPDLDDFHPPELEYQHYGFTQRDLEREFHIGQGMLPGFLSIKPKMSLKEIIAALKSVYCGTIGIEYAHIPDRRQCDWLRERYEVPQRFQFSLDEKRMILDRLIWSDSFERFVATKWSSEKRFGLEGCEALIPGMKAMIDRAVDLGTQTVVMGMPHRGRLNVLSNVVRKPNESIFCEFSGSMEPGVEGSGDVKYHLGMNYDRPTPSGKRVHLSLVANPSHLEAVDPVVQGKVRATQFYTNDEERREKTMALLLHGDAAFAAQGVVYETFGFSDLPNYTTGGTIHIVVNNQIGFTTDPRFNRSTPYCTDVAKTVGAPIFHVNGDDVESVVYCCQLAADWRQTFKKDVVVDIVCYRRHGHNEVDQPSFTQPLMYQRIQQQKPVLDKYIQQLLEEGSITREEIEENKKRVWAVLEENYEGSKQYQPMRNEWVSSTWKGFKSPKELASEVTPIYPTGIPLETLHRIGQVCSQVPSDFSLHPVLQRILKQRMKSLEAEVDWSTAEALAFGSLLLEGKHVRLSGQDVERGTFSQRHAVLHDQRNEQRYIPLNHLSRDQAHFTVCNSSLSEFGTLGFELGYTLVNPNALVLWEAQFGDFSNNAQCIIDQFIASGEKKWLQRTGLTLLLPHGFDGAGPEHSSARLERFLQLCDDHPYLYNDQVMERQHQDCNMQVVYCSTPANYFHVLRRQLVRDFRKPLIVMTSKSLLRHPLCKSSLEEMSGQSMFKRVIPEPLDLDKSAVKKVVFCTGQVYYALSKCREVNNRRDISIHRVEQLSPFPFDLIKQCADQYPNAEEILWTQEEPMNMGAWTYIEPRIVTALKHSEKHQGKTVKYVGRRPTGAVATGNKKMHEKEEFGFLAEVFVGEVRKPEKVVNGLPVW